MWHSPPSERATEASAGPHAESATSTSWQPHCRGQQTRCYGMCLQQNMQEPLEQASCFSICPAFPRLNNQGGCYELTWSAVLTSQGALLLRRPCIAGHISCILPALGAHVLQITCPAFFPLPAPALTVMFASRVSCDECSTAVQVYRSVQMQCRLSCIIIYTQAEVFTYGDDDFVAQSDTAVEAVRPATYNIHRLHI